MQSKSSYIHASSKELIRHLDALHTRIQYNFADYEAILAEIEKIKALQRDLASTQSKYPTPWQASWDVLKVMDYCTAKIAEYNKYYLWAVACSDIKFMSYAKTKIAQYTQALLIARAVKSCKNRLEYYPADYRIEILSHSEDFDAVFPNGRLNTYNLAGAILDAIEKLKSPKAQNAQLPPLLKLLTAFYQPKDAAGIAAVNYITDTLYSRPNPKSLPRDERAPLQAKTVSQASITRKSKQDAIDAFLLAAKQERAQHGDAYIAKQLAEMINLAKQNPTLPGQSGIYATVCRTAFQHRHRWYPGRPKYPESAQTLMAFCDLLIEPNKTASAPGLSVKTTFDATDPRKQGGSLATAGSASSTDISNDGSPIRRIHANTASLSSHKDSVVSEPSQAPNLYHEARLSFTSDTLPFAWVDAPASAAHS